MLTEQYKQFSCEASSRAAAAPSSSSCPFVELIIEWIQKASPLLSLTHDSVAVPAVRAQEVTHILSVLLIAETYQEQQQQQQSPSTSTDLPQQSVMELLIRDAVRRSLRAIFFTPHPWGAAAPFPSSSSSSTSAAASIGEREVSLTETGLGERLGLLMEQAWTVLAPQPAGGATTADLLRQTLTKRSLQFMPSSRGAAGTATTADGDDATAADRSTIQTKQEGDAENRLFRSIVRDEVVSVFQNEIFVSGMRLESIDATLLVAARRLQQRRQTQQRSVVWRSLDRAIEEAIHHQLAVPPTATMGPLLLLRSEHLPTVLLRLCLPSFSRATCKYFADFMIARLDSGGGIPGSSSSSTSQEGGEGSALLPLTLYECSAVLWDIARELSLFPIAYRTPPNAMTTIVVETSSSPETLFAPLVRIVAQGGREAEHSPVGSLTIAARMKMCLLIHLICLRCSEQLHLLRLLQQQQGKKGEDRTTAVPNSRLVRPEESQLLRALSFVLRAMVTEVFASKPPTSSSSSTSTSSSSTLISSTQFETLVQFVIKTSLQRVVGRGSVMLDYDVEQEKKRTDHFSLLQKDRQQMNVTAEAVEGALLTAVQQVLRDPSRVAPTLERLVASSIVRWASGLASSLDIATMRTLVTQQQQQQAEGASGWSGCLVHWATLSLNESSGQPAAESGGQPLVTLERAATYRDAVSRAQEQQRTRKKMAPSSSSLSSFVVEATVLPEEWFYGCFGGAAAAAASTVGGGGAGAAAISAASGPSPLSPIALAGLQRLLLLGGGGGGPSASPLPCPSPLDLFAKISRQMELEMTMTEALQPTGLAPRRLRWVTSSTTSTLTVALLADAIALRLSLEQAAIVLAVMEVYFSAATLAYTPSFPMDAAAIVSYLGLASSAESMNSVLAQLVALSSVWGHIWATLFPDCATVQVVVAGRQEGAKGEARGSSSGRVEIVSSVPLRPHPKATLLSPVGSEEIVVKTIVAESPVVSNLEVLLSAQRSAAASVTSSSSSGAKKRTAATLHNTAPSHPTASENAEVLQKALSARAEGFLMTTLKRSDDPIAVTDALGEQFIAWVVEKSKKSIEHRIESPAPLPEVGSVAAAVVQLTRAIDALLEKGYAAESGDRTSGGLKTYKYRAL